MSYYLSYYLSIYLSIHLWITDIFRNCTNLSSSLAASIRIPLPSLFPLPKNQDGTPYPSQCYRVDPWHLSRVVGGQKTLWPCCSDLSESYNKVIISTMMYWLNNSEFAFACVPVFLVALFPANDFCLDKWRFNAIHAWKLIFCEAGSVALCRFQWSMTSAEIASIDRTTACKWNALDWREHDSYSCHNLRVSFFKQCEVSV